MRGVSEDRMPNEEGDDEDFSPRYTTEEEAEGDEQSPGPEPGEETKEIGSAQVFRAERRVSPGPAGQTYGSPRFLQASRTRRTPPKTPHPPGAYASTTPFGTAAPKGRSASLATPLPMRQGQSDLSGLDSSRSRLFGYQRTPAPPGAYSSPFPHPKRPLTLVREHDEQAEAGTQASIPTRNSASLRAMSTTPQSSPPKARPSASQAARNAQAAEKSSPSGNAKGAGPPSADRSLTDALTSRRERTGSAESVLQTMMAELVRPLQSLLSSLSSPREETPIPDSGNEVVLSLSADTDALSERKIRKVSGRSITTRYRRLISRARGQLEQDSLVRQLAEADRLDRSLSPRLDEIRRAVDEMGHSLSMQVGEVLSTSFAHESRRRKGWLLLAIILELLVLWAIFAIANSRADMVRQTTYFDPFYPPLFQRGPLLINLNHRIPPSFISSFSAPAPAETQLVPVNWQSAVLQHLLQYKSRASLALRAYIGATEFVHGTYTQLGAVARSAVAASEQAYRVPT